MDVTKLDPEIKEAIVLAPSKDPRTLSAELTKKFGKVIPSSLVMEVRGSLARDSNVERARERASGKLDENLDIMGEVKNSLLELFRDRSIPIKQRMEISKELRMWTKTETDTAGISDASTNTLFVIDPEWSMERRLEQED